MDAGKIADLKTFVSAIKAQPDVLAMPELSFFVDYLKSMGCSRGMLPKASSESQGSGGGANEKPSSGPKRCAPVVEEVVIEEEESEDEVADYVSDGEDEEGMRLKEDSEAEFPDLGLKGEKELTDEEMDKQGDLKSAAQDLIEDGDLTNAIAKLTEAFAIGNVTAMMYAKRGDLLLKSKKPLAAIRDCEAALEQNPDSAKAYRIKGMAERRLGRWEAAHKDLETAQKLDFDDGVEDYRKFVEKKWKRMDQVKVAQRLQKERKAEEERVKRVKKAQVERKKAVEVQRKRDEQAEKMGGMPAGFPGMPGKGAGKGGMPEGMGGMPGGMGGMGDLFSDPELMGAMSNPKIMAAFQEIMSNPAAFSKYQSDPEIMKVMEKLMGKMGGAGGMPGMPGGMGGMPGGMGGMPGGMGGMPGGMGGMPGGMEGMGGMGGMPGGMGMPGAGSSNFADVEECD